MEENKRKSMDYQNGKIYKIVCNVTNKIYVGSTCKPRLCDRLGQHAASYRAYLKGTRKHKTTSFDVLENGDYNIVLLERCPCESKEELFKKEREYIERLGCVNKCIPSRSDKEYREANREKIIESQKEHYKANKEKIIEYKKEHYKANKEKIIEYQKEYNKANREKLKEKRKEYREQNKERISAKVKCACGCEIRRDSIARHQKTKKHLDKMIQFNDNSD